MIVQMLYSTAVIATEDEESSMSLAGSLAVIDRLMATCCRQCIDVFHLRYKLDVHGLLRSVAAIFGGRKSTCNVHQCKLFVAFSLQVKQIRKNLSSLKALLPPVKRSLSRNIRSDHFLTSHEKRLYTRSTAVWACMLQQLAEVTVAMQCSVSPPRLTRTQTPVCHLIPSTMHDGNSQ